VEAHQDIDIQVKIMLFGRVESSTKGGALRAAAQQLGIGPDLREALFSFRESTESVQGPCAATQRRNQPKDSSA
jgi:hypothetical protein